MKRKQRKKGIGGSASGAPWGTKNITSTVKRVKRLALQRRQHEITWYDHLGLWLRAHGYVTIKKKGDKHASG